MPKAITRLSLILGALVASGCARAYDGLDVGGAGGSALEATECVTRDVCRDRVTPLDATADDGDVTSCQTPLVRETVCYRSCSGEGTCTAVRDARSTEPGGRLACTERASCTAEAPGYWQVAAGDAASLTVRVPRDGDYQVTCSTSGTCDVTCTAGSSCLLFCDRAEGCALTCHPGASCVCYTERGRSKNCGCRGGGTCSEY